VGKKVPKRQTDTKRAEAEKVVERAISVELVYPGQERLGKGSPGEWEKRGKERKGQRGQTKGGKKRRAEKVAS